jgi:hypothetical protein
VANRDGRHYERFTQELTTLLPRDQKDREIEDRNMERVRSSEHFPVSNIPVSSFPRSAILVRSEMRDYVVLENVLVR